MIDLLKEVGFEIIIPEHPMGHYFIDAYLPNEHLAFEADGKYWHSRLEIKEHDKKRDAWLLENCSLPVIRLTEAEIYGWRRKKKGIKQRTLGDD